MRAIQKAGADIGIIGYEAKSPSAAQKSDLLT